MARLKSFNPFPFLGENVLFFIPNYYIRGVSKKLKKQTKHENPKSKNKIYPKPKKKDAM